MLPENPISFHSLSNISRSMQLEIRVFSPAIKYTSGVGKLPGRTLPVFGGHDKVAGVVLLDPRYCTSSGRVTVTVGIGQRISPAPVNVHPLARGKVCHWTCEPSRWQEERETAAHVLHLFADVLFSRAERCSKLDDTSGNPRKHCETETVESTSGQCHAKSRSPPKPVSVQI